MGVVSNVGLGSGLDITSLVTQLVDAERGPAQAALNRREAKTKAQISAVGQVKSAFAQLQTAMAKLKTGAAFEGRSVTSADTDKFSARITAGQKPAISSYQVEIESLAQSQKLSSAPTAAAEASTELGTGTLKFTVGDATFDVVVTDDNNHIYGLASAINAAGASKGVQASVVRGDAGYSLSLSATRSGEDGAIEVAQTAGGTSLTAFTFDADTPITGGMTEATEAKDAVFFVDGIRRTSSSNVVTDAINGVELTLKEAETGVSTRLTVGEDSSGASAAVQGFVTAYNGVLSTLAAVSAYDPNAKTAQALNGDAFVRAAGAQLRGFIGGAIAAAASSGVNLGFDTEVDGKLKFEAAEFSNALAANPIAIKSLFSGEDAVLTRDLNVYVNGLLDADDGQLTQRSSSLDSTLKLVTSDRDKLERRLVGIEERYRKQFIALDSLLGKLNSTSQYLGQQLAGLSANK